MAESSVTPTKDERYAAVANALAAAVRAGEVDAKDALRILRHELRRRNTNKTLTIPERSEAAQAVIEDYAKRGIPVPKNGSLDALHADHVMPLTAEHLETLTTTDAWLGALPDLMRVVCVTAKENYDLEVIERGGITGDAKYGEAGIRFVQI